MVAMRMWARDVGEDSARRRDNAAGTHGGLSGRGVVGIIGIVGTVGTDLSHA